MYSLLYVDDEPALLEIGKFFLEQSGDFRVVVMASAQEALDSPDLGTYDAIVSDYQMPGMNGIEFLKAVRERYGEIPFLVFTGRGREEVVIEAINNGADFYVQKGGDPTAQFAELAHKIRQTVRRNEAERSRQESERRLADIIDFLPDAMLAVDREGRVIAWNRANEDLTGVPASMMLGKTNYEYALSPYGERRPLLLDMLSWPNEKIRHYYTNIVHDGRAISAESDLAAPRGRQIHIMIKASPLYNQKGEVTGAIEIVRDITGLKETEQDLRAAYEQVTMTEEELRSQFDDLRATNEQLAAAKDELRRQVDRLAMAQSVGRSGSWEYNVGTDTIWGSAEGFRIFGYPAVARDVPLENIESCIPERMRVHQALVDLVTVGKEYDLEYALNPADGSALRVVHSVARLEKDPAGNPVRIVGIVQDITEHLRAKEDLQKTEGRFAALYSNMREGAALHKLVFNEKGEPEDYVILAANPAFEQQLGISRESVLGKTSREAYGVSEPPYFDIYARVALTGRPKTFETWFAPLKKYFTISVYSPEKNRFVTIFEDITEKKQADARFHESAAKFRALVETSPDMIWEIDKEGVFRYISPTVQTILGYMPEELVGKPVTCLVPEQGMALAQRELGKFLAAEQSIAPFEVPARHRDGHDLVVEIRSFPVTDSGGTVTGFRGVARDITEQKKAEEALRRANIQLTLLGSVTRHDTLNKITVLLGYLKVASKRCSEPESNEILEKMRSVIVAMRSQIEFTRLYQNLGSREPQWIALEICLSALPIPAQISFVAEANGVLLRADPMIKTVFANLVDNSIRHGKHVTAIRISIKKEGPVLAVIYEDNGTGIPVADKERIFDRGYGRNTGFGLFLVREILGLTGISIRETGVPGTGARFEIIVPEGAYRFS
ncbi:PAS domain S-box protein [Methanoregula sp. UBA64]|jgi:PAS domain S-box-containing protein|uniref:response regulator n=1 Tax=Methanoregula sp. UBA64 TaxID=1915554 RepID=UPI0025FECF47|nr:PAS domain S-box protein [Methanoregula sp. UBA64]